jgi:exonuclease III
LDYSIAKVKGEISILQHNVGKQKEAQQTMLEIAFKRKTDLVLVQEPYTWKDKENNKFFTIPHSAFNVILPCNQTHGKRPRVSIYIRKNKAFNYAERQDLVSSTDAIALEISGELEKFILFNIYNEKELDTDSRTQPLGARTIHRVLLNQLETIPLPFLLAGDFNCHHFWWNINVQEANITRETKEFVTWLEKHECQLLNSEEQEGTFFRSNLTHKSVIDLAFHARFKENSCENWARIEDTGSDHATIGYSIYTRTVQSYQNPLQDLPFSLKNADWAAFTEYLKTATLDKKIVEKIESLEERIGTETPNFLSLQGTQETQETLY